MPSYGCARFFEREILAHIYLEVTDLILIPYSSEFLISLAYARMLASAIRTPTNPLAIPSAHFLTRELLSRKKRNMYLLEEIGSHKLEETALLT